MNISFGRSFSSRNFENEESEAGEELFFTFDSVDSHKHFVLFYLDLVVFVTIASLWIKISYFLVVLVHKVEA